MSKAEKIASFDPNGAGLTDSNIYGLPFTPEESDIVLIPVPWEVTVSYGSGAARGPEHILEASFQVDLFHPDNPELWKSGIAMIDLPEQMAIRSDEYRRKAEQLIDAIGDGVDVTSDPALAALQEEVNKACAEMNAWVEQTASFWMSQGKKVALVGGDHSTPLGYYKALEKKYGAFGILHIDAHMDLRIAYEGFTYSHASIMYNTLRETGVSRIVQVGIRDYCAQEVEVANQPDGRVKVFYDRDIRFAEFTGMSWKEQCERILDSLPEQIIISFDIDGLDPKLCPNTGTPVPGGLEYQEAIYLISQAAARKKLIGFDLVEVAPGEDDWNGNVGARLLFHLCSKL